MTRSHTYNAKIERDSHDLDHTGAGYTYKYSKDV